LLVAERGGLITEARGIDYLSRLSQLPIATDDVQPSARRDAVMGLARDHGLTADDATYLELALRSDASLATFDRRLVEAMDRVGGVVYR
jgi:predicted nucleic acid-binding protein